MTAMLRILAITAGAFTLGAAGAQDNPAQGTYLQLLSLFEDWRSFEQPPMREGAPDYTAATTARRHKELQTFQERLQSIDPSSWPVEQQVDYQLVRAEMNGLEFNIRVLQPWTRDPAFYKSLFTEQSDTIRPVKPSTICWYRSLFIIG